MDSEVQIKKNKKRDRLVKFFGWSFIISFIAILWLKRLFALIYLPIKYIFWFVHIIIRALLGICYFFMGEVLYSKGIFKGIIQNFKKQ